jgi:ACS family hexuronate transporter-like MFS transporter
VPADFGSDGAATATRVEKPKGRVRWIICALLFFATTINYIDRQVIGILKPTLQHEFGWSEMDYADIVFFFQLAYAVGLLLAGRMIDRLGTKLGFSVAIVIWSIAAVLHAEAAVYGPWFVPLFGLFGLAYSGSVVGFIIARLLLGFGEAGNFPASIKAVAEWFPKRERAFATGIFNSGTNVGALVTPLAVPWITLAMGWYWAFVITGLLGFFWLFLWWPYYKRPDVHPKVTAEELAYINSDPPEPKLDQVPLSKVLPHRAAWAFAIAKFMTDPVWWLYLFWVPDFFSRTYNLDLKTLGLPIVVIYPIASIGSIGGGYLPEWFMKRGWSANAARKTAMLICAIAVIPIMFAAGVQNKWLATLLIGLACAAHQGWSANVFTIVSDSFPKAAVGTVTGFGGMAGAVGGMLISKITGYLLQTTGSYVPVFVMAGSMYLIALLIVQLLVPRLQMVRLQS